ncbi:hypothetical protein [Niveispirillum fermenti]|uniref:hypothetical protein n=1 Tax=Niveispirillum fermenti TaxID=1233113 RepID=UPI003A84E487
MSDPIKNGSPTKSLAMHLAPEDDWRRSMELSHRVAFLAWLDCAEGATRRQLAAEMAKVSGAPVSGTKCGCCG